VRTSFKENVTPEPWNNRFAASIKFCPAAVPLLPPTLLLLLLLLLPLLPSQMGGNAAVPALLPKGACGMSVDIKLSAGISTRNRKT
jgi:hypothetical protein